MKKRRNFSLLLMLLTSWLSIVSAYADNVARIGAVEYASLAEAIAAVPDGTQTTITIIGDETIVGNVGVTIPKDKNVVLDLNGHTVNQIGPVAAAGYLIKNNGTLTIKDSSDTNKDGTGNGKMITSSQDPDTGGIPSYANNLISNYGNLSIESGFYQQLTNAGYACYVVDNYSGATSNITGGKLTNVAPRTYVVRMFLNSTTATNTLNISGTAVLSGSYAVWMQYANNNANKANLNISGGRLEATDGRALYAGSAGNTARNASEIEVSITGGYIGGTGAWFGADTEFKSMTVSGGTFADFGMSVAGGNGILTGGTYESVSLFSEGRLESQCIIHEGYKCIKDGNVYKIVPSTDEGEAVNIYPDRTNQVYYYWLNSNGTKGGGFYNFYAPFEGPDPVLMDQEFIELLGNVTLTKDVEYLKECSFGDPIYAGGTFNLTFGAYDINLNGFAFPLPVGVSVITDKQTNIFTPEDASLYSIRETANSDGTYTYSAVHFVAKIGETKYASLAEAIAAVPTDGAQTTITMLADEAIAAGLTVAANQNIVLELAGHVVSETLSQSGTSALITNKGTLVIQDNTDTNKDGTGTGRICYQNATPDQSSVPGYASNTIINNGNLTIESGYVENTTSGGYAAYTVDNITNGGLFTPVFTMNGGKLYNSYTDAVRMFLNSTTNLNKVVINGGVLDSDKASGRVIVMHMPSVALGKGELDITGGTINGTVNGWSAANDGGVEDQFSDAQYENVSINISGGCIKKIKFTEMANETLRANSLVVTGGVYEESPEVYVASGYAVLDNTDEETKLAFPYKVDRKPVAQIGETKYATLAEAIAAVPTDGTQTTITMIADETINVAGSALTIAAGKNVVLELNGKEVTGVCTTGTASALITNNGTLKIQDNTDTNKDGTGQGKMYAGANPAWIYEGGENYAGSYASNMISNRGNLTIESGYFESTTDGSAAYIIDNYTNGIAVINGGHLYNYHTNAIRLFCNSTSADNSLTVNGGIIEGYCAIWVQGASQTTEKGSLTINGGTFRTTEKAVVNGTKTIAEGNSYIFVWPSNSNMSFTITGGTFETNVCAWGNGAETISGGMFRGRVYNAVQTGFITAGLFSIAPNNSYIADGYVVVDNTDEATKDTYPYTVVPISYVAKIGDNDKYTTLAEAIAAVADGEEIKMIANSNENVLYDVTSPNLKNKTVTISGEYTLTSPDGSFGFYFGDYDNGNRPTTDKLNVSGITMAKSGGNYTTLFDGVTADLTNVTVNGDGNTALSYANGAVGTLTNVTVTNTGSHTQTWRNTALALQGIGSGTSEVTVKSGSYTSENGYAVYMFSSGGTLNIEGGTFSGALMSQIDNNSYPGNQSIINISGGTFANCTLTESGGENAQIYVSGGTFSINPTPYVLPGYAAVETEIDNTTWWKVGEVVTGDMTEKEVTSDYEATYEVKTQVVDNTEGVLDDDYHTKTVTVAIANDESNIAENARLIDLNMNSVISKSLNEVPDAYNNINVEIAVVATAETPAVANTLVFEVHPEATVYVNSVEQGTVELTNADLAQNATFTFKLPVTGTFENGTEVKVVHKSSDPATYSDETFYATVSDGKVTITVSHFSDFELSAVQQFSELDVVLVDGTSYEECVGRPVTADVVVNSAKYQRTVSKADTWCAWYVPMDHTLTQSDLDNATFYRINLIANAEYGNEVESTDKIWVYLNKMSVGDKLTANRPYAFKSKYDNNGMEFAADDNKIYAPTTNSRLENSTTAYYYNFFGTYASTPLQDTSEHLYYYVSVNGGMSWPGNSSINVGPYRWYVEATQKGGGAYYAPEFVFMDDSDVTSVNDEILEKTVDCYYNLQGMKVDKPAKGTYIVKFTDGTIRKVVM